ncbi:MAG: PAS domain S-box protein [Actinomycetota bacterium]
MPQRIEDIVVLGVISVLVAFFVWIYLRDRQPRTAWWLAGWIAILIHFAGFGIADGLIPGGHTLGVLLTRDALIVAGGFFFLSVSDNQRRDWKNSINTVLGSVGGIAYASATALDIDMPWLYAGIIVACSLVAVGESFRINGRRNWFWSCIWIGLLPYALFAFTRALHSNSREGLDFYLFSLFAITGIQYLRHFRRATPGVIFTAISFLAWGGVFPLAAFLNYSRIGVSSVLWDLPKYSVAFGMLLTLFEDQAQAASLAAQQFQGLFESNLAAVYVSSMEGRLLDCNSAFLNMYGFASKQEALDSNLISECAEPHERSSFMEALNRQGQVLNYECRHFRKDGTPFWILERATIVTDSFGRRVIEGTAIDITERKNAEIGLKQSEERFATLFRQSPVGCAIVSLDGIFLNVNENLLRMLELGAGDVIGKSSVELGFFPSAAARQKFFERLRAHGSVRGMDISLKDSAGNVHHGAYFANLVWVGDKECIFGMMLDQTEQRELEHRFVQAQKMEALGRLAGGVAHDFNNLLGVIGGYAELLETRPGSDENYRRYCSKILDTTERAASLTRQLLTFSRNEIIRPMPLRPDHAIRELNNILPRMVGEDIELSLDLNSTATVVMDKTHFEQIILNIVVNARDAMPSGGQLNITTENVSRPLLSESGSVVLEHAVLIHICDTGTGMDQVTRAHAFEPFYTTKEVGRGTGLGLSTVYGVVQQCKGEITIESEPGQGTRISILLPAAVEPEAVPIPEVPEQVPKGAGTILIVEDEPELLNSNAEFLTSLGYSVLCAGNGAEGLHMAREAGGIDLVISDVVMPKMNGREFTDRLLELCPDTKVLFVSGYADDVVLRTGISMQGTPFLQKPFSLRQLGTMVNELLTVPKLS